MKFPTSGDFCQKNSPHDFQPWDLMVFPMDPMVGTFQLKGSQDQGCKLGNPKATSDQKQAPHPPKTDGTKLDLTYLGENPGVLAALMLWPNLQA